MVRNLERRPRQLIVTSLEEDLLATAQNFLPVTQVSPQSNQSRYYSFISSSFSLFIVVVHVFTLIFTPYCTFNITEFLKNFFF